MIIAHKITKTLQGKSILKEVSFRVDRGQITALIGLNGSGKTTLLKLIAGILKADEGYLRVSGMEISEYQKNSENAVAFISSSYSNLSGSKTVGEAMELCRKMYRVPDAYYHYYKEYAGEALGMDSLLAKECEALSVGERLKAEFFYTLLMRPSLWVMDEPTQGIDYETRLKMYEILKHVKSRYKEMTILVATHNIQEMELLCEKILVLQEGRMIFSGPLDYLKQKYQTLGSIRFELVQGGINFQDMPIRWYQVEGNQITLLYDKHSGGQKQRIVLARAFLRDVDIYIFDEATSALDQYNEKIINDVIHNISKDKIVIIVAHRESSIQLCDRVIHLDK